LNESELEAIKNLSLLHHRSLMRLKEHVFPGMDGMKLLSILETNFRGSTPSIHIAAFDVNINFNVCHHPPSGRLFMNHDIVTLDLVLEQNGLFADGAWTYICGEKNEKNKSLIQKAWCVSVKAVKAMKLGHTSLDVKKTIYNELSGTPFFLIEDACGHGIGRSIHEIPDISYSITNMDDIIWKKGMVITVEPVIASERANLFLHKEKGYITHNYSQTAYFEHMVYIDENGVHCLNIPQINDLDCIDFFSEII